MDGKVCEDCYCSHTCGYCGEFYNDMADADVHPYGKCVYCLDDDERKELCTNCHYLGPNGCSNRNGCQHMNDDWDIKKIAEQLAMDWYEWVKSVCMPNRTEAE